MSEFVDAFLAENTENDSPEYQETRTFKLKEFEKFLKEELKKYVNMDKFYEDFQCDTAVKMVKIALFEQDLKDNVLYKQIFKCFYVEYTPDDTKEYKLLRTLPEKINEYEGYLSRKYGDDTWDNIVEKEGSVFCQRRSDNLWFEHLEELELKI